MDYNCLVVLEFEKRGVLFIFFWVWYVVYDFFCMIDWVKGVDCFFVCKMCDKVDENLKLYLKSKIEVVIKVKNVIFINIWENILI